VRSRLNLDTIDEDAERVLRTLSTIEKPVESSDRNARYIMRIMPYRTVDNVIAGIVVTFLDVTQVTAARDRIAELRRDVHQGVESLEVLLDHVSVGIFILKIAGQKRSVEINSYAARLVGQNEHRGLRELIVPYRLLDGGADLVAADDPLQRAARTGETVPDFQCRLLRADGSSTDVIISATPLFDENGTPRGAIASMLDMPPRKRTDTGDGKSPSA
jgi:two-component system CheB/CheR fusion protein